MDRSVRYLVATVETAARFIDACALGLKVLVAVLPLVPFGIYHYARMLLPWIVIVAVIALCDWIFDDPWKRTSQGTDWSIA